MRRTITAAILFALAACGAAGHALFGPPGLYARSEASASCLACHEGAGSVGADGTARTSLADGSHRAVGCVGCHLPRGGGLRRMAWQAVGRTRDRLLHLAGRAPDGGRLARLERAVARENCRHCHADTVAESGRDGDCLFCHRTLRHAGSSDVAGRLAP